MANRKRGKGALREAWEKRHQAWLKEQHAMHRKKGFYKGRRVRPNYRKRK